MYQQISSYTARLAGAPYVREREDFILLASMKKMACFSTLHDKLVDNIMWIEPENISKSDRNKKCRNVIVVRYAEVQYQRL